MSSDEKICKVSTAELPLACPRAGDELWSAHPRIYLAIEETGKVTCPYCGVSYILSKANEPPS